MVINRHRSRFQQQGSGAEETSRAFVRTGTSARCIKHPRSVLKTLEARYDFPALRAEILRAGKLLVSGSTWRHMHGRKRELIPCKFENMTVDRALHDPVELYRVLGAIDPESANCTQ